MSDYESLRPFCNSARQAEILEAVIQGGSYRKGAKLAGIAVQNVSEAIKRIRKNAQRRGFDSTHDLVNPAAPGNRFTRASTLYRMPEPGEDGGPVLQWVRQEPDARAREEAIRAYVDELAAEIKPRKAARAPGRANKDILAAYPIGDHHFGMYAAAGLAGGDYDLDRAKEVLADAVDFLVASSPAAETAILVNLGDVTHTNDATNQTPKNRNPLDASGYYEDICRAAAFAMARAVGRLLEKHKRVHVFNCPGNHDPSTAPWLNIVLEAYFRNEPRVRIQATTPDWQFYQFGRNMFAFTHGHRSKMDRVPGVMANLAPEMWGATTHRFAYTGHMHHAETRAVKEHAGATVEQFGILAPADAHAHGLGYRSRQEMNAIVYRKEGGQLCRTTYNV